MIKPNHLNYSAPPLQIKTSGHHLPHSFNDSHKLEEGINYTIMPALRPRIGALKSVVVLALPHLTPRHPRQKAVYKAVDQDLESFSLFLSTLVTLSVLMVFPFQVFRYNTHMDMLTYTQTIGSPK